ncbi:MAG: DUF1572 domain-containing protein [marine benthic group bacterium]|nr:DUF1572 domain-containing protein [Gemmatimonadota bacterium]MCL7973266.1 DUF1572 domain-containing protein [Gemmatimonadota bacterium]
MRTFMESIEAEYRRYRSLAEMTFDQLTDEQLIAPAPGAASSIATIARHLAGNLRSRFTDFLATDGEKPWRDRESEFEVRTPGREDLLEDWNSGWEVLTSTLGSLADANLVDTVTIRGEELSVIRALHRSLAHTAYHVGQIVDRGKELQGEAWEYLSIPPGGSIDV